MSITLSKESAHEQSTVKGSDDERRALLRLLECVQGARRAREKSMRRSERIEIAAVIGGCVCYVSLLALNILGIGRGDMLVNCLKLALVLLILMSCVLMAGVEKRGNAAKQRVKLVQLGLLENGIKAKGRNWGCDKTLEDLEREYIIIEFGE